MITPLPGYIQDPNNPNGVIRDPNVATAPGGYPSIPVVTSSPAGNPSSLQGTLTTPPAPITPTPAPTNGAPSQPPVTTTPATPGAGLDPASFMNVINGVQQKFSENNDLINAKNLLIKGLFTAPLTPDEIAKLPPDMQQVWNSGNKDAIELQLQALNERIQGGTTNFASSVNYLVNGYQASVKQAEDDKSAALDTLFKVAQNFVNPHTGTVDTSKMQAALQAMYPGVDLSGVISQLQGLTTPSLYTAGQKAAASGGAGSDTLNAIGTTGSPTIDVTAPGYTTTGLAAAGGRTQSAIDQAALQYTITGKFPTGIGQSSTGAAGEFKNAIVNRAGELNAGGNLASNSAQLKALSTSLSQQTTYLNSTQRSVANAEAGYQQVIDAFQGKVNDSQLPIVNAITNASKYQLSPGDISAFKAGLTEVANEYTNVFSRGGTVTDAVRAQAQKITDGNLSIDDLTKVFNELQAQGNIVINGSNNQVKQIQGQINNILAPSQDESSTTDIPKGTMSSSDYVQQVLSSKGLKYADVLANIPKGQKGVINNATGEIGAIDPSEYDPNAYTSL